MTPVISDMKPHGTHEVGTLWEEHEPGCVILRPNCGCRQILFHLLNGENRWILFNKYVKDTY